VNGSKGLTIIYLTLARIPGERAHSIQIVRTCNALASKGADVYLISPARGAEIEKRELSRCIAKYYGIKSMRFILIRIGVPWIVRVLERFKKELWWKMQAISFTIQSMILAMIIRLSARLAGGKSIIFLREPLPLMILQALKPFHGFKIVYESHQLPRPSRLFIAALSRCDLIISISNFLKRRLEKIIPGVSLEVCHNAADRRIFQEAADRLELRRELGLPIERKLISYVGQLSRWKNPEFIVDAFRELGMSDVLLIFVGGSREDVTRLRRYCAEKSVDNVLFTGLVKPSTSSKYMIASDILVHYTPSPGRGLRSYSPLKIMEYMFAARPIVAPRQPWIEELLEEGVDALLFDENSPSDLAEKIRKLLRDEELASRLASNACRKAEQYTYERRAERILKAVSKILI